MPWFGQKDDKAMLPLPDAERFLPGGKEQVWRAVGTAYEKDPRTGKRVYRSATAVSDIPLESAQQIADDRAGRAVTAALSTGAATTTYAYAIDRLREPLVETVRDSGGRETARVTLNGYGALVINAASTLFVDVDAKPSAARPALESLASRRPELAFRVYETHSGARYLCTSALFDPESEETRGLLQSLGADEKYALLCRVQRSFRARITPKPWRARKRPMDGRMERGVKRSDLQKYLSGMWGHATARYLGTVGAAVASPDVTPVVEYHDRWCQVVSGKPLA